jgi:hypothetical protein
MVFFGNNFDSYITTKIVKTEERRYEMEILQELTKSICYLQKTKHMPRYEVEKENHNSNLLII